MHVFKSFKSIAVAVSAISAVVLIFGFGVLSALSAPDAPDAWNATDSTSAIQPQFTPVVNIIHMPFSGYAVPFFQKPTADLGDAPDSTNSYGAGAGMTAYPAGGPAGTVAQFPTVYKAGSPPYGPIHRNPGLRYYLGTQITREGEADIGPDQDPDNNLDPPLDKPDLDRGDDGINPKPQLPHCTPTTLTFQVTVPAGGPFSDAFVNLWFDWNRNGKWGDKIQCPTAIASEWAVQNQVVVLPGPGTYTFTTNTFVPFNPDANACLWWRIGLSDQPAIQPDGSGPATGYDFGETEDYYSCGDLTPQAPQPDLGDAPDSSNSHGWPMTAYPAGGPAGVLARFPTVFGAGSPPYGPLHHNNPLIYQLGTALTREREADIGPDADPQNNILPLFDIPDLDHADDGTNPNPPLPHCTLTAVTYTVTVPVGGPASQPYVNLWFDWDRSGDWGQTFDCPGAITREWAVQNEQITLPGHGTYTLTTSRFLPYNPNPDECLWWRIGLSDSPATAADGSGPSSGYKAGETEDYYTCGDPQHTPTPTPTPRPTNTPTPTRIPDYEPGTDLGDAPDGTNSFGLPMTAYPAGGPAGVFARFPTVFNAGSPPFGPKQHNASFEFWLGPGLSHEVEADFGLDSDGVNNILPTSDTPDLDKADDGANPNPPLPHCAPTQLNYTVTVPAGATITQAFVNLWFDYDRSGDWGQVFQCVMADGTVAASNEWAVQNQAIALSGGPGLYTFTTPAFLPWNPASADHPCLWWRITLSETAATATSIDGSGPAGGYKYGETEDYYACWQNIPPTETPTSTPTSTPTPTPTKQAPPTHTPTPTLRPTGTPTPTPTLRPTGTPTPTPTGTPTSTPRPTNTPTATPTKHFPSITVIKINLEPWWPLQGWPIRLYAGPGCSGDPLAAAVTNERGIVDFTDLTPGSYSVEEDVQPDYENFTPTCQDAEVQDDPAAVVSAQSPADFPPPGQDVFPSGAGLLIEVPGLAPQVFTLNGPSIIQRGDVEDADKDGRADFQTEILSMDLTGNSSLGAVALRESPTRPSRGRVEQQDPGSDFPADSFFDVFVEVDTALGRLHNEEPIRMEAVIDDIPPLLAPYLSPDPNGTPLLNEQGVVVGKLRRAVHVPLPWKEILIIFVNYHVPRTPTPTPSPTLTPSPTREPPVWTGITSTYWQDPASGQIYLTIHALRDDVSDVIYDFEIYWDLQDPPWSGAQPGDPTTWPPGWQPELIHEPEGSDNIVGIRWVTTEIPLQKCHPIEVPIQPEPPDVVGDFIKIYLTDENHNVIGQIGAQRVPPPGNIMRNAAFWLPLLHPGTCPS